MMLHKKSKILSLRNNHKKRGSSDEKVVRNGQKTKWMTRWELGAEKTVLREGNTWDKEESKRAILQWGKGRFERKETKQRDWKQEKVLKNMSSYWELMPMVREGTMILVDWGICRIHKVPVWLRANIGTVFRDPYMSPSGVFPTALL